MNQFPSEFRPTHPLLPRKPRRAVATVGRVKSIPFSVTQYQAAEIIRTADPTETAFSQHRYIWSDCKLCPQGCTVKRRAFYRLYPLSPWRMGPCDLLIVGEAPGDMENDRGIPFCGPAGEHLDDSIRSALEIATNMNPKAAKVRIGMTNIVACIPYKAADDRHFRPPEKAEADACQARLLQCIRIANPKLVLTMGETAKKYYPKGSVFNAAKLAMPLHQHTMHPSAIIRLEREDPREMQERQVKFESAIISAISTSLKV